MYRFQVWSAAEKTAFMVVVPGSTWSAETPRNGMKADELSDEFFVLFKTQYG